jgi:hypothetical protein
LFLFHSWALVCMKLRMSQGLVQVIGVYLHEILYWRFCWASDKHIFKFHTSWQSNQILTHIQISYILAIQSNIVFNVVFTIVIQIGISLHWNWVGSKNSRC